MKVSALWARVWLLVGMGLALAPTTATAESGDSSAGEPERTAFADTSAGQAPAGVDLDRPLAGGEWRLSYRFLGTWQKGTRVGSKRVDEGDFIPPSKRLPEYERLPETRETQMHIAGLEWAPHDRVTLVARLPVLSVVQTATSPAPATHSDGIGDLSLGVLMPFIQKGEQSTSVGLMLGTPTGSISKVPLQGGFPYPMQLGTGSWTMSPMLNYTGRHCDLSWGGQARALFILNENARKYNRGTEWHVSAWLGWSLADWLSTSLRTRWSRRSSITGPGAELPDDRITPAQDASRQGGHRIEIGPGINMALPYLGQRLAVEAMFPVFQHLDGPQLGYDWVLHAAWRMSF